MFDDCVRLSGTDNFIFGIARNYVFYTYLYVQGKGIFAICLDGIEAP